MDSDQLALTDFDAATLTTWIPPLEPGDRLTRDEFERRYNAMPEVKKAELIEGVVYMPSPARLKRHSSPHVDVAGWLYFYRAATPGVESALNSTVRLDPANELQPDAILFIEPESGGQAKISDDDYVEMAPELVVEVASSSVSYDLGDKMKAYRRNGVHEYVVWRVLDRAIDWFVLMDGEYQRLQPDEDGIFRSKRFPGLWLDSKALLDRNHAAVLQAVQRGVQSSEHAAFVAGLAEARTD
jgi:Uma2 family endonuclease